MEIWRSPGMSHSGAERPPSVSAAFVLRLRRIADNGEEGDEQDTNHRQIGDFTVGHGRILRVSFLAGVWRAFCTLGLMVAPRQGSIGVAEPKQALPGRWRMWDL